MSRIRSNVLFIAYKQDSCMVRLELLSMFLRQQRVMEWKEEDSRKPWACINSYVAYSFKCGNRNTILSICLLNLIFLGEKKSLNKERYTWQNRKTELFCQNF